MNNANRAQSITRASEQSPEVAARSTFRRNSRVRQSRVVVIVLVFVRSPLTESMQIFSGLEPLKRP